MSHHNMKLLILCYIAGTTFTPTLKEVDIDVDI